MSYFRATGNKRMWTLEDDTFLKENFDDLSDEDLALKLNRTVAAVGRRRSDLKLRRDVSRWANAPRGLCSVDGCDRPHSAHSFCQAHNFRFKRGLPLEPPINSPKGWTVMVTGYVLINVPEDTPGRNHRGRMLEHRYVMQNYLGRPLKPAPQETVHHRNGNKQDNRIENLELRIGHHGVGATAAHCATCTCWEDVPEHLYDGENARHPSA